jgi:hypothetical protein
MHPVPSCSSHPSFRVTIASNRADNATASGQVPSDYSQRPAETPAHSHSPPNNPPPQADAHPEQHLVFIRHQPSGNNPDSRIIVQTSFPPRRTVSMFPAENAPQSHIHHHVHYPLVQLPAHSHVHVSLGVSSNRQQPLNLLSRLNHFVRVIEESSNRGATQEMIEHNTLPHKYKRLRRASETDEESEKCTICLCQYELDVDVR